MSDATKHESVSPVLLKDIWAIRSATDYKVHFARWNGVEEPLEAWLNDRSNWIGWQEYRKKKDYFNRPYIFSLMNFYPDGRKAWLFGGVFKVLERHEGGYKVELTDQGKPLIGRLKLLSESPPGATRAIRVNFENHYDGRYPLQVAEIFGEPYSGRVFPGYENVELSFSELEALVRNDRPDWKTALQHVKGVYLITDTDARTPRLYIGSAYGDEGIWSRWSDYVATGHGGNAELRCLVPHLDYCRSNFRFALLEYLPAYTEDAKVIDRESHWKDVLMTRDFGLNQN